jgi:N-acetylmuramoyl-L-alanine amidase
MSEPVLRLGSRDPLVLEIRSILERAGFTAGSAADDSHTDNFDEALDTAVRHFQQSRGLKADGIVGPLTWRRVHEARWQLGDRDLTFQHDRVLIGDDVATLQRKLNDLGFDAGRVDGMLGPRTEAALRDFQANIGLSPTGICDAVVVESFANLARAITGGRPESLREVNHWGHQQTGIVGKVVVIDPGHGDDDLGSCANGVVEAELVVDIAEQVEKLLAADGVVVLLTRGRSFHHQRMLDDAARAEFANGAAADAVISLHIDHTESSQASGVSAFYYGHERSVSESGRMLAEHLLHSMSDQTGLASLGSHPRTWDLLRMTRMPSVRLYLGYASNPADAKLLKTGEFRATVAEQIAAGIKACFSPAVAVG